MFKIKNTCNQILERIKEICERKIVLCFKKTLKCNAIYEFGYSFRYQQTETNAELYVLNFPDSYVSFFEY